MDENKEFDKGEKSLFGFVKRGGDKLMDRWPKDENGEPERAVFLCKCADVDLDGELKVNMLEAYGIPCLRNFPGDGGFGHVVLGMSCTGVEIYVPESKYEDAKALCEEETENNE